MELEKPWTKPGDFSPGPGDNEAPELFLLQVECYLFNPRNARVKDNLTQVQRNALKSLSSWNENPENDRMFRVQDKGSRLVTEWKDKYCVKMLNCLEDMSIFKGETEPPQEKNEQKVNQWAHKWFNEENIGEKELEWITCSGTWTGKAYANIKTHKVNWPYRYIISSIGTTIENLALWVEYHPKILARSHPAYIKDTGHFLRYIEELN